MREHKFKAIHSGLSAVAKRVYEAVPIKDEWSKDQVISEVARLYPSMRDAHAISGCLATMVRSGVVIETTPGKFKREPIDAAAPKKSQTALSEQKEANMSQTEQKPIAVATPIEKIAGLQRLAAKIMDDVKALSSEIETVAIEVEMQFAERDAESQKLRQLQTLLKGLV